MLNIRKNHILTLLMTLSHVLGAQVVDLSSEPAFAPRIGNLNETEISLGMKVISNNRLIIASDLYTRCEDKREKNVYTVLAIDALTGAISNRRTIPALPSSFGLMLDANERPLLVSKSSIQVLDPATLKTTETINFNGLESDAERSDEKVPCEQIDFRTSATPDSKLITVSVRELYGKINGVYQIDGKTLRITKLPLNAFPFDFRTGFDGFYDRMHRRQWYWTNSIDGATICEPCDYLDVLSPSNIVTTIDDRVSVRSATDTIWNSTFSGMRDSFDSPPAGNRFAILAATGNRPFQHRLVFTLFIFDVPHRNVRRIQSFPVKQSGPVTGGVRSAVAFSPDGSQVAVFVNGRLAVIPLGNS